MSITGLFDTIDEYMNNRIFMPPFRVYNDYNELRTDFSKLYEIHIKQNNNDTKKIISYVHIKPTHNSNKYVIFSHANAVDVLGMYDYCKNMSKIYSCHVICYDYFGYGLSNGECTEQGCYDSLKYVVDDVCKRNNITSENIILVGHSLGTGVVVDFVLKQQNWKSPIVLISPYKSIARIVCDYMIVTPIDKFITHHKIGKITCPIKIFHGELDELISISHGKYLYKQLKNKSLEPVWIKCGHNDILNYVVYDDVL